ncbi:MAG: hypothetical protein K8S94_07500 [Planctomycetia bacterium]|nr:hypothetical protein [Planctomycetia bacterium]
MSSASSFNDPAGRELLAAIGKVRRMTSGDPKYHSGRPKKEYASPYLEFLAEITTNARHMPNICEFDPLHADGVRHADLNAGVRVLNETIYECQRSLEGIEHARLDLDARGWVGPDERVARVIASRPTSNDYGFQGMPVVDAVTFVVRDMTRDITAVSETRFVV